ncbi:unnamed protein product [Symbiodinium natans]|uniref:Uncharacterized protein n=1 Tax=Symbiodinium natans TaxID=878477 RepID=A0A812NEL7_9DINO|nr:unnamed protein product [Symbiodinium natans]
MASALAKHPAILHAAATATAACDEDTGTVGNPRLEKLLVAVATPLLAAMHSPPQAPLCAPAPPQAHLCAPSPALSRVPRVFRGVEHELAEQEQVLKTDPCLKSRYQTC